MDEPNSYVHVFDVTSVPNSPPKQVANIPLTRPVTGNESPCAQDCLREGWLQHSRNGRFVFVGDSGDVIDTSTRKSVANLDTLYNTRKFLEIDWRNGVPISTTTRSGLGYVTHSTLTPYTNAYFDEKLRVGQPHLVAHGRAEHLGILSAS